MTEKKNKIRSRDLKIKLRFSVVIPQLCSCIIKPVSFIIQNSARLLSKSEVKKITSGILLVLIDAFVVLVPKQLQSLTPAMKLQSGRSIFYLAIVL